MQRWFQEFRRELSNRTIEAIKLLEEALSPTLQPYWEETLLAYDGSSVSPGGWRPSMRCDVNNLAWYYSGDEGLNGCNLPAILAYGYVG